MLFFSLTLGRAYSYPTFGRTPILIWVYMMCARRVGISVEVTRRNLASLTRIRGSFA